MARRVLAVARAGRIAAVFEHSLYIDIADRWVCLAADAGIGPLTATVWPAIPRPFRDAIRAGDQMDVTETGIRIGARWLFTLARAKTWYPPLPSGWTRDSLARGLRGMEAIARRRRPREGLGAFVEGVELTGPGPREAMVAATPVAQLRDWLVGAFAGDADPYGPQSSVGSLIGLGPGLTPSGDDFLAGVMIAAHALRRQKVAAHLHRVIAPLASRATNPISGAHLAAAAEGAGSAKLHAVLDHVLAGDLTRLPAGLAEIDTIGHSSGWDAFAGSVVTLRAWLAASQDSDPWRSEPNEDLNYLKVP